LESKNLDMVVANDVSEPGSGFDSATNRVVFVSADGDEPMPLMDKRAVAAALLDRLTAMLKGR
jgi:phosphopantothenoylcysteine decarboxylase/phosphopantothenate--cysteine ligase